MWNCFQTKRGCDLTDAQKIHTSRDKALRFWSLYMNFQAAVAPPFWKPRSPWGRGWQLSVVKRKPKLTTDALTRWATQNKKQINVKGATPEKTLAGNGKYSLFAMGCSRQLLLSSDLKQKTPLHKRWLRDYLVSKRVNWWSYFTSPSPPPSLAIK